eukprot:scaffold7703_cov127-Cylindrotheca_fusiformis.AAC.4
MRNHVGTKLRQHHDPKRRACPPRRPAEVVEGCMKPGVQAKTGLSFTGPDGGLEVTEETA